MTKWKKLAATKSSSSVAGIEVDDLLVEIFLRLPSNSTQRFKTICKQWHSLLSTPTFRKQWRNRNLKPSTALFLRTKSPCSTYILPFPSNKPVTIPCLKNKKLKINQSCNGLLLCSAKKWYHVYNPTTDTYHTLPKLELGIMNIHSITLAFDPNIFGTHYKVICCVDHTYWGKIYVYSSGTGRWESVHVEFNPLRLFDEGVYWNGCIHWLSDLTYFDIKKETLNNMPAPPVGGYWRNNYYLGESCDRLVYARLSDDKLGRRCCVDVREMKKDYSEWVYKYQVNLDYRYDYYTSVLSVIHGVEEDDNPFVVLKTREGVVRYHLVSETLEELPVGLIGGTIDRAFQYIESQCGV